MKRLLLVVGLTLLLVGCGGDDVTGDPAGDPLTEADYVAQGNMICEQLINDLEDIEERYSTDMSTDEQRDLSREAGSLTQAALADLFVLSPPDALAADRQRLIEIWEEQQALFAQPTDSDDFFDQIELLNDRFENQAERIWPRCQE